jgi:putative membrane protein
LNTERRKGRSIKPPESTEEDHLAPDSIAGGREQPPEQGLSALHMEPIPIKGLKSFFYAVCVLFFILFIYQTYSFIASLWDMHWFFGASFLLLVSIVFLLGLRTTFFYLRGYESIGMLDTVRDLSDRMRYSKDKGEADILIDNLVKFYDGKPQQGLLTNCLDSLQDYFDDSEALEHIEREFIAILDREATQRISQHCLSTGTAIAISPWALMDVGIALWRNVKMIEEISSIYGFRPTLRHRISLLRMVAGKMVLAGASQALINTAMEGIPSLGVGVPLIASAAQGLGASVYTGRIGIATMELTRPICFTEKNKPTVAELISSTVEALKATVLKMLKSDKEDSSQLA